MFPCDFSCIYMMYFKLTSTQLSFLSFHSSALFMLMSFFLDLSSMYEIEYVVCPYESGLFYLK
jgi:hypothetical protein